MSRPVKTHSVAVLRARQHFTTLLSVARIYFVNGQTSRAQQALHRATLIINALRKKEETTCR